MDTKKNEAGEDLYMIPHLSVEPISENVVRVMLSCGACIEISDSGEIGAEIHISETPEKLRLARFKRVKVISKLADVAQTFRVEMMMGGRGL